MLILTRGKNIPLRYFYHPGRKNATRAGQLRSVPAEAWKVQQGTHLVAAFRPEAAVNPVSTPGGGIKCRQSECKRRKVLEAEETVGGAPEDDRKEDPHLARTRKRRRVVVQRIPKRAVFAGRRRTDDGRPALALSSSGVRGRRRARRRRRRVGGLARCGRGRDGSVPVWVRGKVAEEGHAVERHLVEADEVEAEAVVVAPFRSQTKETIARQPPYESASDGRRVVRKLEYALLIHLEISRPGRDERQAQAGPDKVAVEVVAIVRVQGQVNGLQNVPLESLK